MIFVIIAIGAVAYYFVGQFFHALLSNRVAKNCRGCSDNIYLNCDSHTIGVFLSSVAWPLAIPAYLITGTARNLGRKFS